MKSMAGMKNNREEGDNDNEKTRTQENDKYGFIVFGNLLINFIKMIKLLEENNRRKSLWAWVRLGYAMTLKAHKIKYW